MPRLEFSRERRKFWKGNRGGGYIRVLFRRARLRLQHAHNYLLYTYRFFKASRTKVLPLDFHCFSSLLRPFLFHYLRLRLPLISYASEYFSSCTVNINRQMTRISNIARVLFPLLVYSKRNVFVSFTTVQNIKLNKYSERRESEKNRSFISMSFSVGAKLTPRSNSNKL